MAKAKKRVIPTLDNRRGPYGNEDFGMPNAIEEPIDKDKLAKEACAASRGFYNMSHDFGVPAQKPLQANRLEAIKTKVYGNILTAHQYHTVLDLMQEFSYQTEYRPLTSLDTRLQCIEESLEGVK